MMPPLHDSEPELVPPAELLRLRAALARPPGPQTRARHLVAAAGAAREANAGPAGRFASRGVRAAVVVVASLAITSGLAAAEVLPQPAQRFLSSVSDQFSPGPDAPPATAADPARGPEGSTTGPGGDPEGSGSSPTEIDEAVPTTSAVAGGTSSPGTTRSTPIVVPSTTPPGPDTTVPGPGGPGSPDDPTDPGTDGGPTDPDPTTTTTTTVPGTDGGTDGVAPADATTTTTAAGSAGGGSD